MRKIVRSVNLESKQVEKEQGVSIPQLLCLQFLAEQKDFKANATQLKDFLNLNASTISGILRRLEKKGLVAKLPKASDKRITLLLLTTNGMKLIKSAPITFQQKLSEKLQALPPEKLQTIIDGIDILTNIMEVDKVDASPIITSEEYPIN
ncbi:MarR family transcriptional regulator [Lutibacter sp.]|uniref:MarR family winged helix-turn-helix transcriptional regulator n=1 Tax=Lutibacter sp. TaxID=1925666 RepID=UPI001A32232A|nr:MarR family transcriptional regulator [Lutibacter sp.]MBI9042612.1 MarR family transcriptional regulator [Lutibacter sp.]